MTKQIVGPRFRNAFLWASGLAEWGRTEKACETTEAMNCVFMPVEFPLGCEADPMVIARLNNTLKWSGMLVHMLV